MSKRLAALVLLAVALAAGAYLFRYDTKRVSTNLPAVTVVTHDRWTGEYCVKLAEVGEPSFADSMRAHPDSPETVQLRYEGCF